MTATHVSGNARRHGLDHGEDHREDLAQFEYEQVGSNWRYWGHVRFNQLKLFLSAMGALAAATIIVDAPPTVTERAPLAAIGFLMCAIFMVLEERATFYRRAYIYRALALEKRLALFQYQSTKAPGNIKSEHLYRVLFAAIAGLWAAYPISAASLGGAFAVGLVATLGFWVVAQVSGSSFQSLARHVTVGAAGVGPGFALNGLSALPRPTSTSHDDEDKHRQQSTTDCAQGSQLEDSHHTPLLRRPTEDIRGLATKGNGEQIKPNGDSPTS